MNAITKLYLKIFLIVATGFFLMNAAMHLFWADPIKWDVLLIGAIIVGALTSFLAVYSQKRELKKLGVTDWTDDILSSKQERVLRSPLTLAELYDTLKKNNRYFDTDMRLEGDTIIIKTKLTNTSWGEKITISALASDSVQNEYKVVSKPIVPIRLVDEGRNLDNVDSIERIISRQN